MSAGIVMGTGLVGSLPQSPQSSRIVGSMGTLSILPTVHASGVVFKGLGNLQSIERKIKHKR